MLSFAQRIELLERDLSVTPPAFSMSVDLPFAIFRYDPLQQEENEWQVRREINHLAIRVTNMTGKLVKVISLAELYWRAIKQSEGIEALIELEQQRGFLDAETQVSVYLTDPDWCPLTGLLIEEIERQALDSKRNIIFLTRAGVFAPTSYRISALLEQLMGRMTVPTVLFYPGTWRESLNFLGLRTKDEPLASYRVKIYGRET
ncbi:MAG: DUF1788 domain-containing protein [Anaerolineae bacterium]|nr:DUF1788 domain-containing protein [Anaerolineae bacterium]